MTSIEAARAAGRERGGYVGWCVAHELGLAARSGPGSVERIYLGYMSRASRHRPFSGEPYTTWSIPQVLVGVRHHHES